MSSELFGLSFSNQSLPFDRNVRLYQSRKSTEHHLHAFHDGNLYTYLYDGESKIWQSNGSTTLIENGRCEVLYFPKSMENTLLIKTSQGINFYRQANGRMDFLARSDDFDENEFHDVYDWDKPGNVIKAGHFYNDRSMVGIMSNHQEYGLKFYAVIESELLAGEYPIWSLNTNLSVVGNTVGADIFLSDLRGTGQDSIIVRNREGLNIYELNEHNGLERLFQVPNGAKYDETKQQLYFPNLTGQPLLDIVAFNSSGLFIFQYSNDMENYRFIHYNPLFSMVKGWNLDHVESVQFEDVDFDGRHDMVFTGPKGIDMASFDLSTNQWRSLLNSSQLSIPQRHAEIMMVLSDDGPGLEGPFVFTQHEKELLWANIVEPDVESDEDEIEEQPTTVAPYEEKQPVVPTLSKVPLGDERPVLLLRDQLEWSSIVDSVHRDTGRPKFKLPLLDLSGVLSNLKLDFFYDGSSKSSDILGIDWSLPSNFIAFDHQSSVFPEDERYYVVMQGLPQQLTLDSTNSTNHEYWFKTSANDNDLQIRLSKTEDKWEIRSKDIKQTFGRPKNSETGAISRDLVWENWRGVGSSSTRQKQLVTAWYLAEVSDKDGNYLHYRYDTAEASVATGKRFTRGIYLTDITDNNGNHVILKYSNKDPSEYKALPPVDKDGNLNTNRLQTKYLSGCRVITPTYQQDIAFVYTLEAGRRLLTQIIQDGDITNEPILQFFYKEMSSWQLLEKVILPTGATVEFSYQLLGSVSPINKELGSRLDVPTDYRVDYGSDDVLISYINDQERVVLRMFNQDMTKELASSESRDAAVRFPLLGHGSVRAHEIARADDFLLVVLYYSTDKQLCFLRRDQGKWQPGTKCFSFGEDAVIRFGKDFVVVADVGFAAQLIEWNKETDTWVVRTFFEKSVIPEIPLFISASDRSFVTYDNKRIFMGYRKENVWKSAEIAQIPGVMQNIKETLYKFELESKSYKQLMNYFTSSALHIDKNLILLNGWNAEGMQLYSMMHFLTLNSSYQKAEQQLIKVPQDNLNKFSQEFNGQEGNFFTIAYKLAQNKFKLMVKSFRGPIYDEIENHFSKILKEEQNVRNRQNILREWDKTKDEVREKVINSLGKVFLLTPGNYTGTLSASTASCGNRKFTFVGDKWREETVTKNELEQDKLSVPLGDKLVLDKPDPKSSLKLYKQGTNGNIVGHSLLDLGVIQLNQTLSRNMFPAYMAYHEKGKQVGVVEFTADGNMGRAYSLPAEEKLSRWSSYPTLVTNIDHFGTNKTCTVVFRQQLGIRRLLPNPVVSKTQVTFGQGNKRVFGFEYRSANAYGDVVYYGGTSMIPGNDKSSFGWVEQVRSPTNQSEVRNEVFDAQGSLITNRSAGEEQTKDHETEEGDENLYVNTTLLDRTGRLEVAQFFPFELADEEVGYYGFEDYEANIIGGSNPVARKKWAFNESDVVHHGFSFTGQNLLSLSDGILVGKFQPKNLHQEYVASCWLRSPHSILELGAVVPYLKATVQTGNDEDVSELLSEVKFQSRDWFYLEVVLNLLYSKQINDGIHQNTTSVADSDVNLKVSITVGPTANSTIEVDHIRFSPLKSYFQANVYDIKTGRIKEVVGANGLVKRQVYNKHQESIASIDEYGQLTEFSSHSKASSVGRIGRWKSSVQVQPETGFHEVFAPLSFQKRWSIDQADDVWRISPGQLYHSTSGSHSLRLNLYDMSSVSFGMRLCYSLQSATSGITFNRDLKLSRTGRRAELAFLEKALIVPPSGEILIISEYSRLFVWVDGGLYFDTSSNSSLLELQIAGDVHISDLLVFSEPRVLVTYSNDLNEKLQEVALDGENTAVLTAYLYDKLGRQAITTQSVRVERTQNQSLLAYYPNFVTNGNPSLDNSVWNTGKLQGDITRTVGEYGHRQIQYDKNPLNEKCAEGLPGKDFSVSGPYAKRFSYFSKNSFINNLFPASQNYSYQVEHKPGNVDDISVFDSRKNRVAWYVHVPRSKDLLSTYEYGENGKVVKSLPPMYHEKVQTLFKLNSQLQTTSEQEQALQKALGVHVTYNSKGSETSKSTPDSGRIENLYDDTELLRYVIYHSNDETQDVENVVYFNYDGFGRVNETGRLTTWPSKDQLLAIELSGNNTEQFQQFYQSDFEREPIWRGHMMRTITFNNGEPLIEESALNAGQETLSKRILIPNKTDTPLSIVINKRYAAGQLKEIEYPLDIQGKPLRFSYSYNKLGKVTGIRFSGSETNLVSYTYNSAGQIASEQHLSNSTERFTRLYSYGGPGFITKLEDKFLTEKVYYTSGSYGGHGYGDGTVTRTEFKATWHGKCDDRELGLDERSFISKQISAEESALCFHELKEAGYLNGDNQQSRAYYPEMESKFPIVCSYGISARHIQTKLGEKGYAADYGHSYDYGNHQELTQAKYFIGGETLLPIQPDTFAREIQNLNTTVSRDIWQALETGGYLITDNAGDDVSLSHSKRGKSFLRPTLLNDLRSIDLNYGGYKLPLEKLLTHGFSQRQDMVLLKTNLREAFSKWVRNGNHKQIAERIIEMLETKQYLHHPLNEDFNSILEKYKSVIPDVVRVLSNYFARQLGESEFDVESYDIDVNGNHKHYYTGFDRYELSYHNNTNQPSSVKFRSFVSSQPEQKFAIEHDSRGNVVQALHKGIKRIHYNPVSNRATKMDLADGASLTFYYDAQGERVLKRVANGQGNVTKEIHYIRDEFGRTLVERQITYISPALPPDVLVTAYVYGPRGLVGFLRRDEFYSVITDHEGSIRLVVKGDEVVAAYDYLPYGNLMRKYGRNPEGHVSYRYTGQEWDEETGLYNYHARFYDPSIGRFYQVDPKGQYFSPYKYAGNSPISMVDPDGQLAWFILIPLMIVLGIAGAYLGGAAANNNWNPAKWVWKSGKTWQNILLGGAAGALIPVGFGGSVGFFTGVGLSTAAAVGLTTGLGVVGSYLSMVATNKEWDPRKWDLRSPETWNAAFQGFALGSGAASGLKEVHDIVVKLSRVGKALFIGGSAVSGAGMFVLNGWENGFDVDWAKTGIIFGLLNAGTSASGLPDFFRSSWSRLRGFPQQISKIVKHLKDNRKSIFAALSAVKNEKEFRKIADLLGAVKDMKEFKKVAQVVGAIPVVALSIYLTGSAVNENTKRWDMTSAGTYQAILDGLLSGRQISSYTKKAIIKVNAHRKVAISKRVTQTSQEVAKKAIEHYKDLIDNNRAPNSHIDTSGSSWTAKERLKLGEIPNYSMSLAYTKEHVIVSFSSNEAPGLVLVYSHSKLGSPTFLEATDPSNNGKFVHSNDNNVQNSLKLDAIQAQNIEIKKMNIEKFNNDPDLTKKFNEQSIDNTAQNRMIDKIRKEFSVEGYVEKSTVRKVIETELRSNNLAHTRLQEISDKIGTQKTEREAASVILRDDPRNTVVNKEMKNIKKKIRELKKQLRETKQEIANRLTESTWEYLVQFKDPTNSAEAHAVAAVAGISKIFPKSNYAATDIKYLATYKLENRGELAPLPRCPACVIMTEHVKHVITDPYWLKSINDYKARADYSLYSIFDPCAQDPDENPAGSTATHSMGRRSVEPIQYTEIANVASSAKRLPSWITGVAAWLTNSVSRMYTKPALPGPDTARSISQVSAPIDGIGTLVLLDVIVRKLSGQTYNSTVDQPMRSLEAQGYAMSITEEFEMAVEQAAARSKLSVNQLNIDYIQIQSQILGKIMSGSLDDIPEILRSRVMESETSENQDKSNFNQFMAHLDVVINEKLNQIVQEITQKNPYIFTDTNGFQPNCKSNRTLVNHVSTERNLIQEHHSTNPLRISGMCSSWP